MHIIREEMEDQEDDVAQIGSLTADSATPPRVGGLSRALNKQVSSSRWSRSFSLHNLLDQEDFEEPPKGLSRPGMQGHKSRPAEGKTPETNHPMLDIPENEDAFAEQREAIVEGIDEFIEELKDTDATIATHAPEHIHANEVILTFGYSYTVLQFLKRAKEKRNFQVIVSEGAPLLQGYKMANNLESLGIRTTVIADASCYAIMSRVNKVLLSAHALLADGGVMAPVGTSMVAAAAKRYMVPVVVLAGIYKLSPNFPHEPGVTFNDFGEPSEVLPFSHESVFAAERAGEYALFFLCFAVHFHDTVGGTKK
jgi:translation initiation factor eIF-2B subunit beta